MSAAVRHINKLILCARLLLMLSLSLSPKMGIYLVYNFSGLMSPPFPRPVRRRSLSTARRHRNQQQYLLTYDLPPTPTPRGN
jgi:hypothetical protein